MADYLGDAGKLVSSKYLYDTLQDFKENQVDNKVDKAEGYALSKNDLTDALKTSYDGAVTKAHTHTNKAVLDAITSEDIENWNAKLDGSAIEYIDTITTTGTGNAITAISKSGNTVTATKGSTFLTAHPTITKGTDTTTTATPTFGGSFTAIGGITTDANGHVTAKEVKTITLPTLSFESTALDLSTLT